MAYTPACIESKSYGLLDLKISAPPYVGTTLQPLIDLGTAVDSTQFRDIPNLFDIHGDENGGQMGQPVEVQYLPHMMQINLELRTWNQTAIDLLEDRAAVNATKGTILQSEVGTFLLKENSFRLLIDTLDAADTRNFWCCLCREPIAHARGTKWASYTVSFTAYRPPCYHEKADILYDTDNVGGV